jgi:6-phosphogluconolactonase
MAPNTRLTTKDACIMTTTQRQFVFIGTYTQVRADQPHRAESIYIYAFDPSSGTLHLHHIIHDAVNPSFLTLSNDRQHLFAVNEVTEFAGMVGGGLSAFTLDLAATHASFINAQPTRGTSPCYVTLDATERWALVANYGGGSVTVFPIADDGRLGEAAALMQNHGHSVNLARQEAPHAHCVIFDPTQQYILLADLGLDQIQLFRFDAGNGQLRPHSSVASAPGAGPRHLAFHPNQRYLYVVHELSATVGVYDYNADHGVLQHKQTIVTLPEDYGGPRWAADLHLTRSGHLLYVSNRAHNSITAFAVDPHDGQLTLIETVSSGGQTPRNFALDLTERFLLVANQDSSTLVVFQVDPGSGRLTQTASALSIPSPVCVNVISSMFL